MWYVYFLECGNKSLYCGITNNLNNRIKKHQAGVGAKYTRSHLPVELKTYFLTPSKSDALKLEYYLKSLNRTNKLRIIEANMIDEPNFKIKYYVLAHAEREFETEPIKYSPDRYSMSKGYIDLDVSEVLHISDSEENALKFISDTFEDHKYCRGKYHRLSIQKMYIPH